MCFDFVFCLKLKCMFFPRHFISHIVCVLCLFYFLPVAGFGFAGGGLQRQQLILEPDVCRGLFRDCEGLEIPNKVTTKQETRQYFE